MAAGKEDLLSSNIMDNPAYKKFVFIDYGFRQTLEEYIGKKTYTALMELLLMIPQFF